MRAQSGKDARVKPGHDSEGNHSRHCEGRRPAAIQGGLTSSRAAGWMHSVRHDVVGLRPLSPSHGSSFPRRREPIAKSVCRIAHPRFWMPTCAGMTKFLHHGLRGATGATVQGEAQKEKGPVSFRVPVPRIQFLRQSIFYGASLLIPLYPAGPAQGAVPTLLNSPPLPRAVWRAADLISAWRAAPFFVQVPSKRARFKWVCDKESIHNRQGLEPFKTATICSASTRSSGRLILKNGSTTSTGYSTGVNTCRAVQRSTLRISSSTSA